MAKDPRIDTGSRSRPPLPAEAQIKLRFDKFASFVSEYSSLVSRGGVFLKTDQLRPVGSEVMFDFRLVDGFRLFHGQGEVAWVRPSSRGADRPQGLGVRFTALDEKGRELVLKILEEQVKAGGAPFEIDVVPPDATKEWPLSGTSPSPDATVFAGAAKSLPADGPKTGAFPISNPDLGEEPTLITARRGSRDGGFDAPWGQNLPEVPTDLLDDGEIPVNVPSVTSPSFDPAPSSRRSEPGRNTGLFTAAFPDQLTKLESPSQMGFAFDDIPTAPVKTMPGPPPAHSSSPDLTWDNPGASELPVFGSESPSWTFDPTADDTLLPQVEDPLVDLEDPVGGFELDTSDEQPTMMGKRSSELPAVDSFVFEPPAEEAELEGMVLPEPIAAIPSSPPPAAPPEVPMQRSPLLAKGPAAEPTTPWNFSNELPPWQTSPVAEDAFRPASGNLGPIEPFGAGAEPLSPPTPAAVPWSPVVPSEPVVAERAASVDLPSMPRPSLWDPVVNTGAGQPALPPEPLAGISGIPAFPTGASPSPFERPLVKPSEYSAAAAWNQAPVYADPLRENPPEIPHEDSAWIDEEPPPPSFLARNRTRIVVVAAVLALAATGAYFIPQFLEEAPSPVSTPAPSRPKPRTSPPPTTSTTTPDQERPVVAVEPAPSKLAEVEPSLPAPKEEPTSLPQSTGRGDSPAQPSPPLAETRPALGGARILTKVQVRESGNQTEIVLEFDGPLGSDQFTHDPMAWAKDREKIVLRGLEGVAVAGTIPGKGRLLKRIRVGVHPAEIWLVLDKDVRASVLSLTPNGSRLTIVLI